MATLSKANIVRISIFHSCAFLVFFVGVSPIAFAAFLFFFVVRTFGVAAGYHRYFSHRSFETSRWFQFVLAFLGASSGQKGPLSWATSHRIHHRYSDTPKDPHTPKRGFLYGYIGWLLPSDALHTDKKLTADFDPYPEIAWINTYYNIAPVSLALFCAGLGTYLKLHHPELQTSGLQLFTWGFVMSGILCLHGTLLINTLGHMSPEKSPRTNDHSRNVAFLLPVTLGECWHHNHHSSPTSANCGFKWWQVDFIYLGIVILGKLGIVYNIHNFAAKNKTSQR